MAGIAHVALQRWGLRPTEVAAMGREELAFLAASLALAEREERWNR